MCTVIEFCVSGVMLQLFKEFFPNTDDQPQYDNYHWVKLWLGFYLNNAILPVNMLITYLNPAVQWGGSTYVKCQGRVLRRLNS